MTAPKETVPTSSGVAIGLAADEDRHQAGAWRALPVLITLYALSLLDRQVLTLLVGPIKQDLQISDFQIGILQGVVFAFFYAVAGIPLGWAADRFPRRPVICIGVMLWSAATAACGFVNSFAGMVAARIGVGVGEAALAPAANSMLSDLFRPSQLALALSILSIGASLGNGLSVAIAGYLIGIAEKGAVVLPFLGEIRAWQFVFITIGTPGIFLAFLIFLVSEPVRTAAAAEDKVDFGRTIRYIRANPEFFTSHFLGFGLLSTIGWGFISWTPTYMSRAFDWPPSQTSVPLAIILATAGTIGTIGTGALVDRLFSRGRTDAHLRVYAVIALVMMFCGIAAFRVTTPYGFLALIVPIVAVMTVAPIATAALHIVSPPRMRGQINAIYLLVMNGIGLGLGPALVGGLTDFLFGDEARLGSSLSLLFLTLAPLAALALWRGSAAMRLCVHEARNR